MRTILTPLPSSVPWKAEKLANSTYLPAVTSILEPVASSVVQNNGVPSKRDHLDRSGDSLGSYARRQPPRRVPPPLQLPFVATLPRLVRSVGEGGIPLHTQI